MTTPANPHGTKGDMSGASLSATGLSSASPIEPVPVSPLRASIPSADDSMRIAADELRGCLIRRPGPTCEVRKEFLTIAIAALDRAIVKRGIY